MLDSTSGISAAKPRVVTKPKLYDEQLAVLVESGTKARIEAVRGDKNQATFLRDAIDEAIKRARKKAK